MLNTLMATYKRLPVTFVRGEGAWLWDTNGKRYLDALAGIAVCGLGHAHPEMTKALCAQLATLVHTSNLYGVALQESLGQRLINVANMERVFFANSGAEANEAAIKIARIYGHSRGLTVPNIIVMEGSFHGRTLATLTATGNPKVQAGFEPLVPGFIRIPYNDVEALQKLATNTQEIAAVLVEAIQGEGGIIMPAPDYLNAVQTICKEHNWLLMVDEIQTGMGRTGRMFAHQYNNIVPDVMTLAKGLGNGIPIGACLARGEAALAFAPGNHGSTFGGNPFACRAALTVLDIIERDQLIVHSATLGLRILQDLRQRLTKFPGVIEIRGQGLMLGIELARPCGELVTRGLEAGLLINVTAERIIRLLPPLIFDTTQANQLVDILSDLIERFLAQV